MLCDHPEAWEKLSVDGTIIIQILPYGQNGEPQGMTYFMYLIFSKVNSLIVFLFLKATILNQNDLISRYKNIPSPFPLLWIVR